MKHYIILLGLAAALCFISCSKKKELITAEIVRFDSYDKEVSKTAHTTDISVMGAIGLAIDQNTMVVFTINPEALMTVVDLDTDSTLLEFGRVGRGPGEYITLTTAQQFVDRDGHLCLWTHNTDLYTMLVDITESVKQQRLVYIETIELGSIYRQRGGLMILPDGDRFVKFPVTYNDARDNIYFSPRYAYFSPENKQVKELKFFNGKTFSLSESDFVNAKLLVFDGRVKVTKDGTKAVDAYLHADHLNFLDLVNNKGFSVSHSKGLTADELSSMSMENMMQKYVNVYNDVEVTDSHVLALYSGKPESPDGAAVPDVNSAIRIFDWDGTPLALVNLDRELRNIAYDERTKRIYGLEPDENIVYYELDDVI